MLSTNRLKVRITSFLICALFFVPPLIFVPGRFNDSWIFVNYREPKLVAVQILAWLLITWSTIAHFNELKAVIFRISKTTKIIFALLCLLTFYICLSALWAAVPQAALYEAYQWATLCFLFYVLLTLFLISEQFWNTALYSFVMSFAIVTLIGLVQTQVELPFLAPIEKKHSFTSTFGAKNTCFVTLASQLFLVLYLVVQKLKENRILLSVFFGFIFVMELIYISISSSRTTYVAVTMGYIIFLTLLFLTGRIRFSKKATLVACSCVVFFSSLIVLGLLKGIGPNLVANPGFEIGTNKTGMPKNWNLYPHRKGLKVRLGGWSASTAHSGDFSVSIIGNKNLQIGWKGKPIFFEPPYPMMLSFSGWSKAKNVNECGKNYSLLFKINFTDHTHAWYRPPELNFSCGTHDWELKKSAKYWHKSIASVQPYCIMYNTSGQVWFDDVSVRPYNSLAAYLHKFYFTWRERILPYFINPKRFFTETARGAAILDTLEMVKEHPLGVGAGNWGFLFPLYHKHMLKKSFSEKIQIRRAHNDFVELLGELGLLGFSVFLFLTIYVLWNLFFSLKQHTGNTPIIFHICLISQFIVLIISMSLTFYLEYPYRKFQYIFYVVLVSICIELLKDKRQHQNAAF